MPKPFFEGRSRSHYTVVTKADPQPQGDLAAADLGDPRQDPLTKKGLWEYAAESAAELD